MTLSIPLSLHAENNSVFVAPKRPSLIREVEAVTYNHYGKKVRVSVDSTLEIAEQRSYVAPRPKLVTENLEVTTLEDIKQRFSGVILSVSEDSFEAQIEDVTDPDNANEIVVMPITNILREDFGLLRPGAMFFWYIGYKTLTNKQIKKFSILKIRRLPQWTTQEIKAANERAKDYAKIFKSNNKNATSGNIS